MHLKKEGKAKEVESESQNRDGMTMLPQNECFLHGGLGGFKHHNLDDGPSEEGCSRELRFMHEKKAAELFSFDTETRRGKHTQQEATIRCLL
jgi:hypothetical protein